VLHLSYYFKEHSESFMLTGSILQLIYYAVHKMLRAKTVLLLRKQTNRKLYANIRSIVIHISCTLLLFLPPFLSILHSYSGSFYLNNFYLKSFVLVPFSYLALCKHKSNLNGIHKSINRCIDR